MKLNIIYGFKETIYNIVKCIPEKCQICLFTTITKLDEVIELTNSFMNKPEKAILVKKKHLH